MTEPVQKSEMRDAGVRGILIYCADYHCSHSLAISGDRWPDDVWLSDIQDRFACAPLRQVAPTFGRLQLEHKASRYVGLPLRLGRCTMIWSPGMVPYGADQTVYLVMDSFGVAGAMYRETEIELANLETVISDLLTGQFNAPVRIVAYNTLEHWAQDVSQEVAEGIQTRCDIEAEPVPEHVRDFVETHRGAARRLALRFGS